MSKLVVYSKKNKASVSRADRLRKKHSQYQFADVTEKKVIADYKKTLNIPGNEIIEFDKPAVKKKVVVSPEVKAAKKAEKEAKAKAKKEKAESVAAEKKAKAAAKKTVAAEKKAAAKKKK